LTNAWQRCLRKNHDAAAELTSVRCTHTSSSY
jgi:hypothetical protein